MVFLTRCFHFDADGRPIRGGCMRFGCKFAHPDDPEWNLSPGPKRSQKYLSNRRPSSRSRSPRRSNRARSISPSRQRRPSDPAPRMDTRTDSYHPSPPKPPSHSPAPSRPPPPPFSAPPVPPPPALPAPPPLPAAFSALESGPAPKPLTRPEMKVMWDKILPLMADCVEARKAHQDSLNDIHNFEKMLQTRRYLNVTAVEKERVDRQLAELKAAAADRSSKVTEALKLLKDTNWWPVGPDQEEGAVEKYRELIQYAVQLNTTATEMYQEYVKNAHNAAASGFIPQPAVNLPDPNSRPLKRRRVSNAADSAPSLDPDDEAEFEQLRDKLMTLEERLADIQNDVLSLETRNEDDINAQIDARLESISLDPQNGPHATSDSRELEWVSASMQQTNSLLDELTTAVTFLTSEAEKTSAQRAALDIEEQKYPNELMALQQRFQAYEDANEKDQQSMEALTEALNALRARPPTPPSLPLEFILSTIDEPIRDSVQSAVRPIVDRMAKQLQEKIVQQDAEIYGQLWDKITLTLKVVNAVSKVTPAASPVS